MSVFLLQMLVKDKRTVSSIAKEMGVHPANITHHFKLLERTGLILLVEKRDTGKNLEKYYRAIAYNFEVSPANMTIKNKKVLALSISRNDLSAAINAIKEDDSREMTSLLSSAKISQKDAGRFIKKLGNLVKEFSACGTKEGSVYNLNLSIYPNDVDFTLLEDQLMKKEIKLK